jgi:hypothetical protein
MERDVLRRGTRIRNCRPSKALQPPDALLVNRPAFIVAGRAAIPRRATELRQLAGLLSRTGAGNTTRRDREGLGGLTPADYARQLTRGESTLTAGL